jgi:hypothetical protein
MDDGDENLPDVSVETLPSEELPLELSAAPRPVGSANPSEARLWLNRRIDSTLVSGGESDMMAAAGRAEFGMAAVSIPGLIITLVAGEA